MARLLFILVPLAVAFWIYSVVDCAIQPPVRHRGVPKAVWIAVVVVFPVVGGLLWFIVGRGGGPVLVRAPDDDPAFLQRIGTQSDQDDRIRRLEEELAQLDAEADDPRFRPRGGAPAGGTSAAGPVGTAGTPRPASSDDGDDDARGQRGAVG